MTDEPDNLTLRMMRRMGAQLDRLIEDVGDLKSRITSLEESVVGVHRRLDRNDGRLDRIEKRLDLVDG